MPSKPSANRLVPRPTVAPFECASDSPLGANDYAAIWGVGGDARPEVFAGAWASRDDLKGLYPDTGIWEVLSTPASLRGIEDGLTNTVLLYEQAGGPAWFDIKHYAGDREQVIDAGDYMIDAAGFLRPPQRDGHPQGFAWGKGAWIAPDQEMIQPPLVTQDKFRRCINVSN